MNNKIIKDISPQNIYLLGAGASCSALPLATGVSSEMSKWSRTLAGDAILIFGNSEETKIILEIAANLLRWGEEASLHYSIDTLAKKIYLLNKNEELDNLKVAMTMFFMLEQSLNNLEQRYDSFFASILENPGNPPNLPESIGILTWNYDRQLEKVYHQYCFEALGVYNNITNSKQIVRLNGLLGRGPNKGTGQDYTLTFKKDKRKVYNYIIEEYKMLKGKSPFMYFAFEDKNKSNIDKAKILSKNATTLVIIGYSFPFFNRLYDREILESMENLEHIYLQVLPKDIEAVKARLLALRKLPKIEFVDDQSQFYVPHDF